MEEFNDFVDVLKSFMNYESAKGIQVKVVNEGGYEFSDGKNIMVLQLNSFVDRENIEKIEEGLFNVPAQMSITILVEEQCSKEFQERIMSDLAYFFEHFDGARMIK